MTHTKSALNHLPISLFGSVMGLSGLSSAWKYTVENKQLPIWINHIFSLITVATFIALLIAYSLKIIKAYPAVENEFKQPISKSFFGTPLISLLLLPIVIHDYTPKLAHIIWLIGSILMLLFAIYMVGFWISTKHQQAHITPAWIIPVVGTLDIPLAAHLFPGDYHLLNLAALSIGLFFTTPLITLILSRIIFFEKLPQKLMPSLMILLAPFTVGALAYQQTLGADNFMLILYFIGLFFFIVLSPQLLKIAYTCPFRITWWAIGFPIAALLNTTFHIAAFLHTAWLHKIALLMLILSTLIFLWLIIRTLTGIFNQELEKIS